MLTGENLVYFGPEKWEGLWRNRHQLMTRFARQNRVLYVEPKVYVKRVRRRLRKGRLRWRDFWLDLAQSRVTKAGVDLYVYHPPLFVPIAGRYPLDRMTWHLWTGLVKMTMRRLGFREPIIWLSRPSMANLIGAFGEKLAIYHVVDEYLSYHKDDAVARARQQALESQMLTKADLVIVVSESLLQAKRAFNKHTYLVPNGVDYQAYAQALDSDEPLPPDIASVPGPRLGYSGLIADRLDLDLLEQVATAHPEWSLVLIGATDGRHCADELRALGQMANVHFLGRKEIEQVPYYVKAFDVCLIPYKANERAENASPLKLYDYMALGKPIVTTDFPAAKAFGDIVYIANSETEFTHYVGVALSEQDSSLFLKRRRVAAKHTWEDRVEQLSELIQAHLGMDKSGWGQSVNHVERDGVKSHHTV